MTAPKQEKSLYWELRWASFLALAVALFWRGVGDFLWTVGIVYLAVVHGISAWEDTRDKRASR